MYSLSESTSESLFVVFNWLAIAGAVVVAIGAAGIFWTSREKDRHSNERITANETLTAEANARAAEAGAAMEGLKLDVANANASAAAAKERATNAELALVKYKQPRVISKDRLEAIRQAVAPFHGFHIDILVSTNSFETNNLLQQLYDVLHDSGWTVWATTMYGASSWTGITLFERPDASRDENAAARALAAAIRETDISLEMPTRPPYWTASWNDMPFSLAGAPWANHSIAPIRMIIGEKN